MGERRGIGDALADRGKIDQEEEEREENDNNRGAEVQAFREEREVERSASNLDPKVILEFCRAYGELTTSSS